MAGGVAGAATLVGMDLVALSWNVLADAWADPAWFPAAPAALFTGGRRAGRTAELLGDLVATHGVSVVALQEVDGPTADAVGGVLGGWTVAHRLGDGGRPGLLLAADPRHVVTDQRPVVFTDDGGRPVGRDALTAVVDGRVRVVAAHLRWAPPDTPAGRHPGVLAARQVVEATGDAGRCLVAADLNDLPGGPVRRVLSAAGFDGVDEAAATSVFNGGEPRALDVVASRGMGRGGVAVVPEAHGGMPGVGWPSDHAAVVVSLSS